MLYNKLLHIDEAKLKEMRKVRQLLNVIKQHNLQEHLGVARLHRHFLIKENEYVIWNRIGPKELHGKVTNEKVGYPYVLASGSSQWIPVEYSTIHQNDIWQIASKKQSFASFLSQYQNIIKGEEQIYGLCVVDGIWEETIETTDEEKREQKVVVKQNETSEHIVFTKYYYCQCTNEFCCCNCSGCWRCACKKHN